MTRDTQATPMGRASLLSNDVGAHGKHFRTGVPMHVANPSERTWTEGKRFAVAVTCGAFTVCWILVYGSIEEDGFEALGEFMAANMSGYTGTEQDYIDAPDEWIETESAYVPNFDRCAVMVNPTHDDLRAMKGHLKPSERV